MKRTRGTRRCLNSFPHAFQYGRIATEGGGGAVGVFLFRALNFRAVAARPRVGEENKNGATLRKIPTLKTTVLRSGTF